MGQIQQIRPWQAIECLEFYAVFEHLKDLRGIGSLQQKKWYYAMVAFAVADDTRTGMQASTKNLTGKGHVSKIHEVERSAV